MFADPDDPTIVEVNWYGSRPQAGIRRPMPRRRGARLHDEFPDATRTAMIDGWVAAVTIGGMTRAQFDDAIDGAVKGGLLNADEAEAARSGQRSSRRMSRSSDRRPFGAITEK